MEQIKVELQEFMGSDKGIAESAWTSSLTLQGKEKRSEQDVERIVKMLANEGHSTPFESVVLKFWIKMPIQTDRQHVTHRIASHNGMSGRYRTMPNEYYEIPTDINNLTYKALVITPMQAGYLVDKYSELCSDANHYYSTLLGYFKQAEKDNVISNDEYKRLREFYRGVLPQNNMTERVTVINLRSFANYQKLRNAPNAQPEIQQVAKLMLEAVKAANICPIAIQALEKNNWEI